MISVKEESLIIPTYLLGEFDELPLFLEKRAYQGSSGKVYPYRVVDQLLDKKVEKEYKAVILENDYIKITVLPELGGRIQYAFDKIKERDFIYRNQVIKPALVGLTGPWISGGIEFNWPQHHRPSTFELVEYHIEKSEDGSVAVYLCELEKMNGLYQNLCIRLHKDKTYIELKGRIFNASSLAQTFLWWANPAVKAGDGHQSIFPPDVTAVYDHGKRDVSRFPIATGEYYKVDYSEGVDISRYKNIPVPTSYMAWKSDYDFVGAYSHDEEGGLLHVANHHIAPGKKQWTWGHGNFGRVWDRNLTEEDGPYIELMTGVYTDNQPDFTWLDPYEEKEFTQYFMPYRNLGQIHNANNSLALKCHHVQEEGRLDIALQAFGSEEFELMVKANKKELYRNKISLDPTQIFETSIDIECSNEEIYLALYDSRGQLVLDYRPSKWDLEEIPEPAKSPQTPERIQSDDELYFTGLHVEQYRNPSIEAKEYYLEIIKRDKKNYRANLAMSRLYIRAFQYEKALAYLNIALERQMIYNTNPIDGESSYLKALCVFKLGEFDKALKYFYKAAWSQNYKAVALYYIANVHCLFKEWDSALSTIEQSIQEHANNWTARALKIYILRKIGEKHLASIEASQILKIHPIHPIASLESDLLTSGKISDSWLETLRRDYHNLSSVAFQYVEWGEYDLAIQILQRLPKDVDAMQYYSEAFVLDKLGKDFHDKLKQGEACKDFKHFPNKPSDYDVLNFVVANKADSLAQYYLGNLLYDRKRYDEAYECWITLKNHSPSNRNCSIYLYNKKGDLSGALLSIKSAILHSDHVPNIRMIFEYMFLLRQSGMNAAERNEVFESFNDLISQRDDLLIEWLQTQVLLKNYKQVLDKIKAHEFHPWEGGEGKVADVFVAASIGLALDECVQKNFTKAVDLLKNSFNFPDNINEGKLQNRSENDIHYFLGSVYSVSGNNEEAHTSWHAAIRGSSEISTTSYYNDVPLEYVFFQAMAYRKLGDEKSANRLSYKLVDFGERGLNSSLETDFFAVSMPDFNVYELDKEQEYREKCLCSLMLGFYAINEKEKSSNFREKLLRENPNHRTALLLIETLERLEKQNK